MPLEIAWGFAIFLTLASSILWYGIIASWREDRGKQRKVEDNVAYMAFTLFALVMSALAITIFLGIVGVIPLD